MEIDKLLQLSFLEFKALFEDDDPTISADLAIRFISDKFSRNPTEIVTEVWSVNKLLIGALARGVSDVALDSANKAINFNDEVISKYKNWSGDPGLKNQANSTLNLIGSVIAAVVVDRK